MRKQVAQNFSPGLAPKSPADGLMDTGTYKQAGHPLKCKRSYCSLYTTSQHCPPAQPIPTLAPSIRVPFWLSLGSLWAPIGIPFELCWPC